MIDWSNINWILVIAQIFGLLQSTCCIIGPYFKYRWQMLINSMVSVSFLIINLILLSVATPDSPVNLSAQQCCFGGIELFSLARAQGHSGTHCGKGDFLCGFSGAWLRWI